MARLSHEFQVVTPAKHAFNGTIDLQRDLTGKGFEYLGCKCPILAPGARKDLEAASIITVARCRMMLTSGRSPARWRDTHRARPTGETVVGLIIHAPNVHQGGGRVLLLALLGSLRGGTARQVILDTRLPLEWRRNRAP